MILSYSAILLAELHEHDPHARDDLDRDQRAPRERAGDLTRQLLAFSRQQVARSRESRPERRRLRASSKMLRRIIGEDIALSPSSRLATSRRSGGPGSARASARESRRQRARRDARRRRAHDRDVQRASSSADVRRGRTTASRRAVRDARRDRHRAPAWTERRRARIFEPFFTTKEVGQGHRPRVSPRSYGIVKQCGGHIWVYSEPGVGTTFKIYFPALRTNSATRSAVVSNIRMAPGSETILLTEDEAAVRMATRTILEQAGYKVIEAANGHLALDTFRKRINDIDLVMTDMIMPGMNGRELADQLRAIRPDIRLLFTSGYTDDTVLRQSLVQPGSQFIQKPYTPQNLTAKVREALSSTRTD